MTDGSVAARQRRDADTVAPSPNLTIECTYIAPTVRKQEPVGLAFLAAYG